MHYFVSSYYTWVENKGLELLEKFKKIVKDRHSFTTPTGTRIQDKEFYFNNIEKYFKSGKYDSKWIDILNQIIENIENENIN